MKNNYKSIKALFLLGAISLSWQSSLIANERNLEQIEEKGGFKRSYQPDDPSGSQGSATKKQRTGATETQIFPLMSLPDAIIPKISLPDAIIPKIFIFLSPRKDQNALFSLLSSCKMLNKLVKNRYAQANEAERHHPWKFDLCLENLLPSTLYIFNTRMQTILGLYANIIGNAGNRIDHIQFEKLCYPFVGPFWEKIPLFFEMTLPVTYIQLLHVQLSSRHPTTFQVPLDKNWRTLMAQKTQICLELFRYISRKNEPKYQNEMALY
jgi:hypothetical protein